MINLVSLLTAALVSLQCCYVGAAIIDSKNNLNNNLQPNVAPTPRRRLGSFVKILSAPPESVSLIPGSPLELSCVVAGHPAPTIQWLKNGEPLPDYEESANEILNIHPSSIVQLVTKLVVTTAGNGDEYTCIASSGIKQKIATTIVYTTEGQAPLRALFRPSTPVIVYYYDTIFQNQGTTVVLPCRVSSYSQAQVYWMDNADKLIYGNSRMQVLPSGDLLISVLEWRDMGNFTCTAKNLYGKVAASTFVYPVKA
ncbi:neural/ectodermal development factor IMP-L2-like [Achroia grisella]|uniref:neural/ectodermal development factor IMP-L2-like n=1 Tax=Achroia grisella TaxID=688607 RepID=UPI0027D3009C|nr:neural/ectodermal development factor IMP-L2-like [Achroia grisella]